MAAAETVVMHMNEPEPDSGTQLEGSENASSGSNEENNGETSPVAHALNTNYDSSDGAIPVSDRIVHRCDKCDNYETLSRAALIAHMARCSLSNNNDVENTETTKRLDRKLFECDVCNMKFSNGANMRRHKMRHTGVKPYECRVCQKRFFRKDHLAEHFTTHTKTLPYHCPICNRGFQRQIAMRAHFQNEHVGQHDMIKSCPLCSFRAGTMKSLRVHFFSRHGIDLDNPGNGPPAMIPLTVEATASATYSDSGDSQGARSADNATPPMHFLTPHVEISMTDTSPYSPVQPDQGSGEQQNGDLSSSPNSGDSNVPTSSLNSGENNEKNGNGNNSPENSPGSPTVVPLPLQTLSVMPSLSVIPIVKQEKTDSDDAYSEKKNCRSSNGPVNLTKSTSPSPQNSNSSNMTSLIKVSPLKSLLRDDLKRKLSSRANIRVRPSLSAMSPSPNNSNTNGDTNSININSLNLPAQISQQLQNLQNLGNSVNALNSNEEARKNLQRHMLSLQNLQCVFCGIWFPDQTLYFLHKGCHCESNPWKCNICGEQCGNVYQFNSHLLSNTHE
ncbi:UNVERIFIED_CONTAM: hypothetical protein PYX00_010219 [Menopon gallinae]|uniref:C2H2-type domain-containing protein n=1 Tax=Menopon gallinae TaxID=328185 RepID=A0AAW2HEE1_9NEOP